MATLITGMSGTGKSSVLARLAARGYRAVDLDTDEWSRLVPDDSPYADPDSDAPLDWRWCEDEVRALLTTGPGALFVAGTSTDQARIHPLLDHVVLLTVPERVAVARLATRTTNDYGKDPAELRRELALRPSIEPLLRASSCLHLDTSNQPIDEVADLILRHAAGPPCRSRPG